MEKTQIASTIYIVAFSKLSQIVEEFLRNGGKQTVQQKTTNSR